VPVVRRRATLTETTVEARGVRWTRRRWRGPVESLPFRNGIDAAGHPVWSVAVSIPGGTYYRPASWQELAAVGPQVEDVERMREIGR
jgi:hypothetical protein